MTAKTETASKACRCCGLSFAGGVPRIKMHLLGRAYGNDMRGCTFVNDDSARQTEFLATKAEAQRRLAEETAERTWK